MRLPKKRGENAQFAESLSEQVGKGLSFLRWFCQKISYAKGEFNHSFGVINIKIKQEDPLLEVVVLTP
jgi:hypothetical protein